jgi:predicted helicase
MRKRYSLEASTGWSPKALETSSFSIEKIRPYLHRPFDKRWIYYDPELIGRARLKVFQHLLHPNVAIVTMRQTVDNEFHHVFCTDGLCDINLLINHHVSDQVFPLYLYQENIDLLDGAHSRRPNIADPFVSAICGATGLKWLPDGRGDLVKTFGPDNVLSYIYAVLHSPEYRRRYWEEIRSAFPRIPVTRTRDLFCSLSKLGHELLDLHLTPSIQPTDAKWVGRIPSAPVGTAKYRDEHIWLDDTQSSGISKVDTRIWQYRVGGYKVCSKWLSDRKGSSLDKEDIQTFFYIMGAIESSIRTTDNIDVVVAQSGGWPDAFC